MSETDVGLLAVRPSDVGGHLGNCEHLLASALWVDRSVEPGEQLVEEGVVVCVP